MQQLKWFLTIALWATFSYEAGAWSAQGHTEIAAAAFDGLSKKEQGALAPLLAAGPWAGKAGTPAQVNFARAATWPDSIRDQSLQQLFERHGSGEVPEALQPYRSQGTAQWHFVNAYFLTSSGEIVRGASQAGGCPPKPYGRLYEIWTPLLDAFAQAEDKRDKAVILAFIVHIVGDAYQPLHTFAALDQHCEHDRGGNGYCVGTANGKPCESNLHQLWDRGFGVFDSDWRRKVNFEGNVRDLDQGAHLLNYAKQIYPPKPEVAQSFAYRRRSAERVRKQARLATAHMRAVLRELELHKLQPNESRVINDR